MEFRLLGPLEVVDGDRALSLGGPKQRAVLALLLLHAGHVVSTERLIDDLWGPTRSTTVAKTLQVYISRLRKELGRDRLLTQPPGYLLRLEDGELDVARFEQLLARARELEPQQAGRQLREALCLWRGPPLADLGYEPFAQAEIARLEELRLSALEDRIDADLDSGRHRELVGEIEALIARHPLRERLRGQLILALYRSGRQAEALETFRSAREKLVEELGIEPGRGLRELHEAVLRQDAALELAGPARTQATDTREARPDGTATAKPATRGALVGRDTELNALVAALDDAFAGRGRIVLVDGEPGIGKSRLAEELAAHARVRGAHVLVGRCWEAGGAPAYWPWVQALRSYVREADDSALHAELGAGAGELAQILPELRDRLHDVPELLALDPERTRFRLFDATAELLRNVAATRPVVVIIDDLHAADAPSLLLLRFVGRALTSARMLVVAAYRDVDPLPGASLTETLSELLRESVTSRLSLRGLSDAAIAEYVDLTASHIASPALVTALREETEGNPLFIGEIVRLLAIEGVRDHRALTLPQSVRDVIERRLSHLTQVCREALTQASVIGREFPVRVLALMADVTDDALLDTLDDAIAARVVSDVPGWPGRLRFTHMLIRDTLYAGLTPARQGRLHRTAMRALEAMYGDQAGPHLAELAHHAVAARQFDTAVAYARHAGDVALTLLAYEEAARLYEMALEALELAEQRNERTRCALLLALGDAESRAGSDAGAKRAYREAAAIARRLRLSRELAHAAAEYGGRVVFARASSDEWLLPLLEDALTMLSDDDVELRVRLLARLAASLRDEPDRSRRDALSREAVELARANGDMSILAYALDGRAITIVAPDTPAEILEIGRELRELGEHISDPELVLKGHLHPAGAQLMLGQMDAAEAGIAAANRIAVELRQPAQLWDACSSHALIALATGRFAEAEHLTERALEFGERAQPDMVIPVNRMHRYALAEHRGRLADVEPDIRRLADDHPSRPLFSCAIAHVHARLGRREDAARQLDRLAGNNFAVVPFDQEWLLAMSLLAETVVLLGDGERASVLHRLLLPWAALNAVDQAEGFRGSVSRDLGTLAALLGGWDDAERHFETALANNAKCRARPWLAHTRHDYARMLSARGRAGDRKRAHELRDAALADYRELGMAAPTTD